MPVPLAPGPGDPPTVVAVTPPAGVTRLQWATGTFPTPAGTYEVSWRRSRHGLRLNLGCAGQRRRPLCPAGHGAESGDRGGHARRPLARRLGHLASRGSALTLSVPAGTYDFFVAG